MSLITLAEHIPKLLDDYFKSKEWLETKDENQKLWTSQNRETIATLVF